MIFAVGVLWPLPVQPTCISYAMVNAERQLGITIIPPKTMMAAS